MFDRGVIFLEIIYYFCILTLSLTVLKSINVAWLTKWLLPPSVLPSPRCLLSLRSKRASLSDLKIGYRVGFKDVYWVL